MDAAHDDPMMHEDRMVLESGFAAELARQLEAAADAAADGALSVCREVGPMRKTLALGACAAVLAAGLGAWLVSTSKTASPSSTAGTARSSAQRAQLGDEGAFWAVDQNDDAFNEPGVHGVPLADALKSMDHSVSLLSTEDVGPVEKVLAGEWGMGVRYESGVTLVVAPRRDLASEYDHGVASELDGSVAFSDGKRHIQAEEPPDPAVAASGHMEAFSVTGGTQLLSGNRTLHVRTQLYWNDANFTYSVYSQDDTVSLDQLRQYIRNTTSTL